MDGISPIKSVTSGKELSPEQEAVVEKLAARDRDVRAHEAAHLAAAGSLASGVEYTYRLGPDGKLYAVGGNVKMTIPAGLTPEKMLAAARTLHSAAGAPADPSGQDMSVSAKASRLEADALQRIAEQRAQPGPATSHSGSQTSARGLDRLA